MLIISIVNDVILIIISYVDDYLIQNLKKSKAIDVVLPNAIMIILNYYKFKQKL